MQVTPSYTNQHLVTKREAAELLRVSVRTIDRYIADRTIKAIRVSPRATRITRASLDALLTPSVGEAEGRVISSLVQPEPAR
jgi:excisionase family DNA binding protein